MQDNTTTTQAPVTQQSSIPSSAPVPNVAYQQAPAQTAQASYQTASDPSIQQTAPQAPQVAPQAPQVANPWESAFNALTESLSATQNSQPQAAYSTPTQQAPTPQENYPSQVAPTYQAAPSVSGTQTYLPQATQAYSQTPQVQAQTSTQQENVQSPDGYLGSVSGESLEVLKHFGAEAPALLNKYACVVEDALLAQTQTASNLAGRVQKLTGNLEGAKKVVDAAASDNAAYHTMLTNPDMLSSYVNEFFGPNGPHPVELSQDRLAAEVAANEARFGQTQAPTAPVAPAPAPAPQAQQQQPVSQPEFKRPQLDMPQPGVQAPTGGDDFWSSFSALSDKNPQAAWQLLSQATPDALRSKVLVSEA